MLIFIFHLHWNVLGTTPFLWSDAQEFLDSGFAVHSPGLSDPTSLLNIDPFSWEEVCPVWERLGRKSWACTLLPFSSACSQGVHPGLLSVHRWAYQVPCPYCGRTESEWDGFQTVLGSCAPKAQFPMNFISNRAPFVSCLLLLCLVPKLGGEHRAVI